MTQQEILEEAIAKAVESGWDVQFIAKDYFRVWYRKVTDESVELGSAEYRVDAEHYRELIFNHAFAKALWGNRELVNPYTIPKDQRSGKFTGNAFLVETSKGWQQHLQQMVIAPDPIEYLGEHL